MGIFDKDSDNGNAHQDLQNGINQMQSMYGMTQGNILPWLMFGGRALPRYESAISPMLDPKTFYNNMMSGYTETPAAKLRQQEGEQAYDRSAAASGMLGSGALGKAISNFTQKNIAADQQNYLNNILGIYEGGVKGYQDLARMGLQGGLGLGNIGASYAGDIGNLYGKMSQEDWAQQQQDNQNIWSALGFGGNILNTMFGGGFGSGAMGGLPIPFS